jgi:hypothetical protein
MVELLRVSMAIVSFVLAGLILMAPVAFGAYLLLFSRRFSLASLQYRKRAWKIGFTDFDVRVGQVFALVVGGLLAIGGLIVAAQFVFQ